MELGALELQIFVSLIVILGTAFVALVCDYLKGSNESLREHNIELRVRREEQERNRPVEAVEWLQQMLGATRANPVRFGSMRSRTVPGRNRATTPAQPAKPTPAEARPAAAATPRPEVRQPQPHPRPVAVPPAATAAPTPKPDLRPEPKPVPAPAPVPEKTQPEIAACHESPAISLPEPKAVGEVPNLTRSVSSRTRRAGTGPRPTTSLLDTLPVPAWVKREQEEIAAARAKGPEPVVESLPEPIPFPQPEPFVAPEPVIVPVSAQPIVAELPPAEPLPLPEPVAEIPAAFDDTLVIVAEIPAFVAETPAVVVETPAAFDDTPALVAETPAILAEIPAPSAEPEAAPELQPAFDETPNFTFVRETLPEISFAPEPEPVISIWRTDVEPIVPVTAPAAAAAAFAPAFEREALQEPNPVPTTTFWSYRGLMDREPEAAKTGFVAPPVAVPVPAPAPAPLPELEPAPAPVAETPKREELTRDNFILYRGLEPTRTVEPEPEFVGIESRPEPVMEPIPVAEEPAPVTGSAIPELDLPAGYQDRAVLQQLMTANGVLTGVVVAIGINDYQHQVEKMGASAMQDLMRNVEQMIAGLLRPGIDFGCRSSEDEFVLVFNKEAGPEAQRRLSTISERLWNFQLRSLTSFSVFFSWGAVEVQGETLADAAASASERMYQTKRNRKTVAMDQRRKKAVNL
ncbi:MAG: diguanylate cyclase [Bryobacterales bacterium]|nr:diguanylate cyclase [Bryobacterales bacterium]